MAHASAQQSRQTGSLQRTKYLLGGRGKKKQFEKAVLAAGTTFKIISSFAVTHSPAANESPYLRPLFNQTLYLYKMVKLMTADAGFISRENCDVIDRIS